MELSQNSFYILGATQRDNRHRITELADELSLLHDSNDCMQARSDLTNPRKRLSLEVAWLPGLAPKRIVEVLSLLETSWWDLLAIDNLTPLARANLLSTALSHLQNTTAADVSEWILEISWAFESIDIKELCMLVNEERIVSGFPEVTDLSTIEAELQERRRHFRQIIKSALDKLPPKQLVEAVTLAVESATNYGEEHGPILIDDLVDSYEVEAQPFLNKEAGNIELLVDKIREAVDAEWPDSSIEPLVHKLMRTVENWDTVAQPIQVSTKSRGLDHDSSNHVANLVRSLAVDLFNDHGKLEFSKQITNMLQEVFAEVVHVAERTAEDAEALDGIAEERARLIEDAKKNSEKWRKEITYEAEVGVLFKDKLRISPAGFEWKGRRWSLESISRLRWGATRHTVNGIPSGTVFTIVVGSNASIAKIELKKENIYTNAVDRLWKAVGARLLTEYLNGLRDGKRFKFGSVTIDDKGMYLERKKLFSSNDPVYCRWGELLIGNGPGVFCVGKKDDKKVTAEFSYQDEDNIHVLEAAIRMFWKRGGDRLSSLLSEE